MKRETLHKLIDRPSSKNKMAATGQSTPSGGKRTLHLLLALGIGLVAGTGWVHAEESPVWKETQKQVFMRTGMNAIFVYANGHPVTINKSVDATKDNQIIITFDEPDIAPIIIAEGDTAVIFGGSKNGTVASSSVTMNSGFVYGLFGGGYGEKSGNQTATVTGESTVKVTGGTIHTLAAGGLHKAKSGHVTLTMEGGTVTSWLHPAGVEQGQLVDANSQYPVFDKCPNTVDSTTLTVNGGRIWCLACGGGNGWGTYVKTVTAKIGKATIYGGAFGNGSNGRSDKVDATFSGTIFDGKDIELAAINRGIVKDVSMSFIGCDFSKATDLHANLGGTYRWGFEYASSKVNVEGVPGSVAFTFSGCTNTPILGISDGLQDASISLTGAKAKLAKFERNANQYTTQFIIGESKTWTFYDGLIIEPGVTLTKTGTLEYKNSFEANVSTDAELKTALDLVNAGDGIVPATINMAAATFNDNITINKSVSILGEDTTKTIFKGAVKINTANVGEKQTVAIENIKFDYTPNKQTSNTRCTPVIEAYQGNVDLQVNNCLVNNNTAGTADRTAADFKYLQNVLQMDSLATGAMTIKNCEINLNEGCQIAVLAEAAKSTVLLQNTRIQTIKDESGNPKGNSNIGIFPHNNGVTVTMDNSSIELKNHYGIYMWSGDNSGSDEKPIEDLKVYLKNKSVISAYGAIRVRYTKNAYISITGGSSLTGNTYNSGVSNDFGTLAMQGNIGAKVDVEDSSIGTKYGTKETAGMTPILFNTQYGLEKGTTITLKGSSTLQTLSNELNPHLIKYGVHPNSVTDSSLVAVEGNNVKFKDQYGKDCIIINDLDGSFRNAAVSIANAVAYGDTYEYSGTKYDFAPIAFPGNIIMATDSTADKALASLNQAKMIFFENAGNASDWEKYTIPDSIVINCKDAYLVTGESAAKSFAEKHSDKAVLWLQQTDSKFVTASVKNEWINISTNAIWDDPSNISRSVEIQNGATLTINVAMALDTVRMHEGAQLKVLDNIEVKANVLQLADYEVENQWKAFGFPVAGLTVKDTKGTEVKTADGSADAGLWTAKPRTTEVGFVVTSSKSAIDSACIIASAPVAKYIITAKPVEGVVLKTNKMPAAPTGSTAFSICANPNTYTVKLDQEAYILSDNGKTFDLMYNPEIKPFQSYILADQNTTLTLRSITLKDTPTGNEQIVPVKGYYVETGRGSITIHTAEPVQVTVVDMLGRVCYNALVTYDNFQITLPAGIYAVNRQKVIVK